MAFIGIDLGTSNSAAAVLRGGRPVIIPSAEGISLGGKAFPSYVAITADGQTLIGEPARRQAAANPEGTASGFKRRMGQRETISLRGKGLPEFGDGGRGDLNLRIQVHIPKDPSAEERALYQQLCALRQDDKQKKPWWQ